MSPHKFKNSLLLDQEFATFEELQAACNARIEVLKQTELLDEDGYPTEGALEIISLWNNLDYAGWFSFIKEIWYIPDWGWSETIEKHEYRDENVKRFNISTGGWSGNESIIRAMEDNGFMLWHMTWVSSRRGGHYIFEYSLEELDTSGTCVIIS